VGLVSAFTFKTPHRDNIFVNRRGLVARQKKTGQTDPDMSDIYDGLQRKARDHARNPMQWDASPHAGFSKALNTSKRATTSAPWMRVHVDYREWNVGKQSGDPTSVLTFWREMIVFRKKHLSCVSLFLIVDARRDMRAVRAKGRVLRHYLQTYGLFTELDHSNEQIYHYTKTYKDEKAVILLNFSGGDVVYPVPSAGGSITAFKDFIGNYSERPPVTEGKVRLRPWEAAVFVS